MRKCRIGTAKFFTLLLLLYHTSVKAHEAQQDRLKNGVPVEENTLAELRQIARELGIEGV